MEILHFVVISPYAIVDCNCDMNPSYYGIVHLGQPQSIQRCYMLLLPYYNNLCYCVYCACGEINEIVIPLHLLYWSIHTKDESKRGTAFAFILGVN